MNQLPVPAADPDQGPQSAPTNDPGSTREIRDARLKRICDYQSESLRRADALEANLAAMNGGLMEISLQLEETIIREMAAGEQTVAQLEKYKNALDMHLRLARQIERYAQLEQRLAGPRRNPTGPARAEVSPPCDASRKRLSGSEEIAE